MNRFDISHAISQIELRYIEEAMEADQKFADRKEKQLYQLQKRYRPAVCIFVGFLAASLLTITAFATSESFRNTIISLLYPVYSSNEIKALDDGHMTGSFDEVDTLLSFLDRFNNEKMEFGVLAENNAGYAYSLRSYSSDNILAIVQCNIPNYKILVTLEKLDYENTAGLWQVVSYQIVTKEEALKATKNMPEYRPDMSDAPKTSKTSIDSTDSIMDVKGACAIIYNAADKNSIATLTEQESRQIRKLFEKYEDTESKSITAMGLQDLIIRYEDIMYAFSTEGDVLIMDENPISIPRAQIVLSSEDLELLLHIFYKYGI